MSTGAKFALGCGGIFFLLVATVAVVIGVGWDWVTDQAGDLAQDVQQQAEAQNRATEILERLERDHRFEPPADEKVDPDRARRFFRATNSAWEELEPWTGELEDLERRLDERDPGLSDVGAVVRGFEKLSESRVILARALEEQEMPLEEYLWTGLALARAREAIGRGTGESRVQEDVRRLVREHRSTLEELTAERDDEVGKDLVFKLAWTWGSLESRHLRTLGLDTLDLRR